MDRHLQYKLQQFSATPPESIWQKVADALDTEESLGRRLQQYEEAPPATAWDKIEKGMDEATPAKVVPFTTRFRKPLRYAAVACILTFLLVTITLTVKRTEAGALEPENTITVQRDSRTMAPSADKQIPPANVSEGVATNDQEGQNRATAINTTVAETKKENSATSAATGNPKSGKAGPVYSSLSEYVFFSDGDGRTRKISKKLASYVNCKDDDLPCKQRLKELRQRMAASAMTTDFTGVLDLLRQLQ